MKPMDQLIRYLITMGRPVSGYEIVNFFTHQLNLSPKSAGASIARAVQYRRIAIAGTTTINNKLYNLYC